MRRYNQHDGCEAISTFNCAKSSITDGSLLLHQSETIRTARPGNFFDARQISQVNREGLFFLYFITSEDTRFPLRSRSTLDEDEYPLLLSLFQYDMSSNQIVIRQHGCIIPRSLLRPLGEYNVRCFPWKDMMHIEAKWSTVNVALRAQLDAKSESKPQILKYRDLGKDKRGILLSVDDVCTVRYEGDYIVTRWFDQLAYEKGRGISDVSDAESGIMGQACI